MRRNTKLLTLLFILSISLGYSQVKIGGVVKDSQDEVVPFANIVFVGSTTGTVSDENGKFYLESDKTYTEIEVSFLGFENKIVPIKRRDFNLTIVLNEAASQLKEVFIYSGRWFSG